MTREVIELMAIAVLIAWVIIQQIVITLILEDKKQLENEKKRILP